MFIIVESDELAQLVSLVYKRFYPDTPEDIDILKEIKTDINVLLKTHVNKCTLEDLDLDDEEIILYRSRLKHFKESKIYKQLRKRGIKEVFVLDFIGTALIELEREKE